MSELTAKLDELDRLAEAATRSPWEWRNDQYPGQLVHPVYLGDANSVDWMERGEVHPENILKCGDWLPSDADAEFIAASRTELPALNRTVRAVLELHKPEKRWQVSYDADASYDTYEDAEDMADGTETGVTYFEVCAECKRVEESSDAHVVRHNGYLTALWPCPTVQAIEKGLSIL